jgi:uncharacterized membrane-anchored protein
MKKILLVICLLISSSLFVFAKNDPDSTKLMLEQLKRYELFRDSVNSAMKYETGAIVLKGGMAKLTVPKGFKYLNIQQSQYIIHDVWGNPERDDILGMIFPENGGPLADSSYGFIVSFDDMGYVKDHDAGSIDYKELLEQMNKEEPALNAERKAQGYTSIHMVGWAQPPYYDTKNKILHWAKELQFGGEEGDNTLNYDIRFLGRKGILSLNAVATMNELPMVKKDIDQILNIAEFTDGNRYSDYDSNVDKVAAYTVGGLVAGKILLKIGFFAKFWKLIVLGIGAIGAWVVRIFKRRKNTDISYEHPSVSSSHPGDVQP